MEFKVHNVNSAFHKLVEGIHTKRIPTRVVESRAGKVAMIDEPVSITYYAPWERVLFNKARDANPFFHLYESLWMLAGRNDVAPLAYYNSKIADIASDDGETFNGAYGYRWKHARKPGIKNPPREYAGQPGINQLNILVDHIKRNPNTRRAVLQMWNVEDDLLKVENTKDTACNVCVFFSVGTRQCPECMGSGRSFNNPYNNDPCFWCKGKPSEEPVLDMTVCNRSNDLIWGSLGANVVHFSFLQEYMARRVGVGIGRYTQFSNNLHVYLDRWNPTDLIAECYTHDRVDYRPPTLDPGVVDYVSRGNINRTWKPVEFDASDEELNAFVEKHAAPKDVTEALGRRQESQFLGWVALPMMMAYHNYKLNRDYTTALYWCKNVESLDWRLAAQQWIQKRKERHERQPATSAEQG